MLAITDSDTVVLRPTASNKDLDSASRVNSEGGSSEQRAGSTDGDGAPHSPSHVSPVGGFLKLLIIAIRS